MQISSFSDYTLRILMYVALEKDRLVTSKEIADTYGLSFDHIAKAAQLLSRKGYVDAVRGRGGGMRLAKKPSEISIGGVLRLTEEGTGLVECMRAGTSDCLLAPVCALAPILATAKEDFFQSLDKRMLSEALPRKRALRSALGLDARTV